MPNPEYYDEMWMARRELAAALKENKELTQKVSDLTAKCEALLRVLSGLPVNKP